MLPKPLLGVFAHPALDHRGDGLHRARDINATFPVAWQLDRFGYFAPEMIAVGLPHSAHAADRAFQMARELRDQRVGPAGPPEEGHIDATLIMLVDQHADVLALLEPARQTY